MIAYERSVLIVIGTDGAYSRTRPCLLGGGRMRALPRLVGRPGSNGAGMSGRVRCCAWLAAWPVRSHAEGGRIPSVPGGKRICNRLAARDGDHRVYIDGTRTGAACRHPAPVFGIGISSGMAARGDRPREALTCCSVCLPRKILSTGSFMICERDRHYEGCVS